MSARMHVCKYVLMYVCMYAYMYVFVYVCMRAVVETCVCAFCASNVSYRCLQCLLPSLRAGEGNCWCVFASHLTALFPFHTSPLSFLSTPHPSCRRCLLTYVFAVLSCLCFGVRFLFSGASGDLAPLAHLALGLMGVRFFYFVIFIFCISFRYCVVLSYLFFMATTLLCRGCARAGRTHVGRCDSGGCVRGSHRHCCGPLCNARALCRRTTPLPTFWHGTNSLHSSCKVLIAPLVLFFFTTYPACSLSLSLSLCLSLSLSLSLSLLFISS